MKFFFWAALVSGPVAVGLWWLAGLAPSLLEHVYSRGFYPLSMGPWSRLVGLLPFAVAPVLIVFLVLAGGALFFLTTPGRALGFLTAGASVLVAWFVLGWGLNYQRLSWAENHGFKASGGTVAQLETLARRLAAEAGPLRARALAAGSPHWAGPTMRGWVTQAYQRAGQGDRLLAGQYGDPKAFGTAHLLSWLGIAGIFIPHTGEPLVNTGPADWQLPFTAAHEAAHLRGWAREDEANFLAYWVLKDDVHAELAYSAVGSALLYVATALDESGPAGQAAWAALAPSLDPGVQEDWKASFTYWKQFQGPVRQASQAVNDLYLKSQGQVDGVKSYGRMVDLLLAVEPGESSSATEPSSPPPPP